MQIIDIPVVLSMCHLLLNKCPDLRHVVHSPLVTCCQSPCSVFMVELGRLSSLPFICVGDYCLSLPTRMQICPG